MVSNTNSCAASFALKEPGPPRSRRVRAGRRPPAIPSAPLRAEGSGGLLLRAFAQAVPSASNTVPSSSSLQLLLWGLSPPDPLSLPLAHLCDASASAPGRPLWWTWLGRGRAAPLRVSVPSVRATSIRLQLVARGPEWTGRLPVPGPAGRHLGLLPLPMPLYSFTQFPGGSGVLAELVTQHPVSEGARPAGSTQPPLLWGALLNL